MKHEPQSIRNTLLLIPILAVQKEFNMVLDLFTLFKEYVTKCPCGMEEVLSINEV
jgi:hypothetical protein